MKAVMSSRVSDEMRKKQAFKESQVLCKIIMFNG